MKIRHADEVLHLLSTDLTYFKTQSIIEKLGSKTKHQICVFCLPVVFEDFVSSVANISAANLET